MENFAEKWSLSFSDLMFLADQPEDIRLETALQLCHLRRTGRFIEDRSGLAGDVISYVASQTERPADCPRSLSDDRRSRRYRNRVAEHLGFSQPKQTDLTEFETWLLSDVVLRGGSVSEMTELGCQWFWDTKLISPSQIALERSVHSARQRFLERCLASVTALLTASAAADLDASLADPRGRTGFQRLKRDVGAATLDSVLDAAERLAFIQGLGLPDHALSDIDPTWIKDLVRRVEGETEVPLVS